MVQPGTSSRRFVVRCRLWCRAGAVLVALLTLAVVLTTIVDAQSPGAESAFKAGVEVVQLDVTVLGKDRLPVRGLTAEDFTILVDGEPKRIVAFNDVEIPGPVVPRAQWMRDVAPDVVENAPATGRVLVVVIDDGSLWANGTVWSLAKTRATAVAALDEMGPDDIGAVVSTEFNRGAQDFTKDRALLRRAIDRVPLFPQPSNDLFKPDERGSCLCGACSVAALRNVAEALMSFPERRKTVLLISAGVVASPFSGVPSLGLPGPGHNFRSGCADRRFSMMVDVFRKAALGNVTMQVVNANAPCAWSGDGASPASEATPLSGTPCSGLETYLRTIAETTGGQYLSSNDPERQVYRLFRESASYYMLGIETGLTTNDGREHKLTVKVDRPGLEVRTRSGYYAPRRGELEMLRPVEGRPLETAIGGALPRSDVRLGVVAAPFAGSDRSGVLALVLSVARATAASNPGTPESVQLVARAFRQDTGKEVGRWTDRLTVRKVDDALGSSAYEVLNRLPLPPGRYQIRLGVELSDGTTGSVYTYAEVPDFSREELSMSGLAISASGSMPAGNATLLTDLMPVLPTARREFGRGEVVSAAVRIFQGKEDRLLPAVARARVVGDRDDEVFSVTRAMAADEFRGWGSVDYRLALPLRDLRAGEYLLSISVEAGRESFTRTARFSIRPD
jgi:VWFA-related protein